MRIIKYWKELKTPIKAVVISVLGAIIVALIGRIDFSKKGELKIIEVTSINDGNKRGIEIVIHNESLVDIPVTAVELSGHADGIFSTIGSTSYELEDLVMSQGNDKSIEGLSRKPDEQIKRPIHGRMKFFASGGWDLMIKLSIRENLKTGESKSIIFFIPKEIEIKSGNNATGTSMLFDSYIFNGRPKKFLFERFFSERIDLVKVVVVSSRGLSEFTKSLKQPL
jgi:hypothetical protein